MNIYKKVINYTPITIQEFYSLSRILKVTVHKATRKWIKEKKVTLISYPEIEKASNLTTANKKRLRLLLNKIQSKTVNFLHKIQEKFFLYLLKRNGIKIQIQWYTPKLPWGWKKEKVICTNEKGQYFYTRSTKKIR